MKRAAIIGLIVLLFGSYAHAADIRAWVDRAQIAMGESIQLTVSVKGQDAEVDVSGINDFRVVSSGTATSIQVVNGRMSREVKKNFMLIPLKQGRLVIPPLKVVADGQTFQTQSIVVQVSKEPVADSGQNDLFVRAQVSKKDPYEGQQIIYTFRLYTAVRMANAKFRKPDFSGFSVKEIDDTKTYQKVISGREYTVSEVACVLVPLKTGNIVIQPGTFSCDLVRQRTRRSPSFFDSFFDDSFFGQADLKPKILTTDALTINVKPLPSYPNKDLVFSGLVGHFELKADIEHSEIKVGDSATLSMTITGNGNVMDAVQPDVAVPDAFKVYADQPQEKISVDRSGFSGEKVFRVALVAVKPGTYSIPPVRISYFDVSQKEYRTLSTRPFSITVQPSSEKEGVQSFSAPAPSEPPGLKKRTVEFSGRDILPLKEEMNALENQAALSLLRFIILFAVPILLYIAVRIIIRMTRKSEDMGSLMVQRSERALKQARKPNTSKEEFLAALYRSLVSAIFSTTGTRGESLTYAEAEEILSRNGYSQEIAAQAAHLLRQIESTRYGGLTMENDLRADLFSETKAIVRRLLRK